MNQDDMLDPSEQNERLMAAKGDNGEIGARFKWRESLLKPYSLHHRNAHFRLAWDNLADQEYAQMFLWLLTKSGEEVNAIRGDKAVSKAQFEAIEWAQKEGALNKETASEMVKKMQEIRADAEAAESLSPVSRGGSLGNA